MANKPVKQSPAPDWAERIGSLRLQLSLTQASLGQQLHYSAMAVSRWERGLQEPPADCYIRLGDLAGNPDCWYFWERAGFRSSNVISALPKNKRILPKETFPEFDIVIAGSGAKIANGKKSQLVAIPLLSLYAGSHGTAGDKELDLEAARAEEMVAALASWCPNPSSTTCLRVKGTSMAPLITEDDIMAVDYSQTNHATLDGKVVIAWHKDTGLSVSRFRCYRGVQILEAENREYQPVTLGCDRGWRIIGRILWWTRMAP